MNDVTSIIIMCLIISNNYYAHDKSKSGLVWSGLGAVIAAIGIFL